MRDEIPRRVWAAAQRNPLKRNKNLSGTGGRKSQGALARLCEFPMPQVTIEILIYFGRTDHGFRQPARCARPRRMRGEYSGRLSNQVQHLERNSIGESQPRHLRGRLLSRVSTSSRRCLETERKSQPLGKKKRSRPLAFSLEPRSHGEEG